MRKEIPGILQVLLMAALCTLFAATALAQDEPEPPAEPTPPPVQPPEETPEPPASPPEEEPAPPVEEPQLPPDEKTVDVPADEPVPLVTILTYLQKELGISLASAPELEEKQVQITLVGVPWRKALDEIAAKVGGKVVQEAPNLLKIVPADGEETAEEQPEETPEKAPAEEEKPAPKKTIIPCLPAEYVCGKGFVWKSDDGDYSLRIGGRMQFHWILDNYDIHRTVRPEHNSEFGIPRAYLFISGHAFRELQYLLNYRIDNGVFDDWAVIWTPTKQSGEEREKLPFDITLGHFKPVFSREFLTSSGGLSLVNRNLADAEFRLGRDDGVNITTRLLKDQLKFDLGLFNGMADSSSDNTGYRITAKLQLNLNNPPSTQGDLKKSEKPGLSLGFAYSTENDVYDFDMNGVFDDNASRWTLDAALYWQGLNVLVACFSRTQQNAKTGGPGDPYEKSLRSTGYSLQASYFVVKSRLELVALMSFVEPDVQDPRARHGATSGWQHEMRFGIGYYISGHTLKLQLDWGTVRERQTHGSLDDHQLRMQLTMSF